MKERFDDPTFYDRAFYSKGIRKFLILFAVSIPIYAVGIFIAQYLLKEPWWTWKVSFIMIGAECILVALFIIFLLRRMKKLQLGVGSGGIYVYGYGMLSWSKIKKIEIWQHREYGKTIKITTHSPIERDDQVSWIKKFGRSLADVLGENLDEVFIFGDFVSTSKEELVALLREYHKKYQQEGVARASVFDTELPQIGEPARKISRWWIKIGILITLVLGSVIVSLVRGRSELWVNIGVAVFAGVVAFFSTPRLVFLWVVSVGLILFGTVFFVYTLIWEKKLFWGAFAAIGFGAYLVFILIIDLLKRRKQKVV